jgi:hypothetical protein
VPEREREREMDKQEGLGRRGMEGIFTMGDFFLVDTIEDNEVMYYFPSV